jgi:hypothetical protein
MFDTPLQLARLNTTMLNEMAVISVANRTSGVSGGTDCQRLPRRYHRWPWDVLWRRWPVQWVAAAPGSSVIPSDAPSASSSTPGPGSRSAGGRLC